MENFGNSFTFEIIQKLQKSIKIRTIICIILLITNILSLGGGIYILGHYYTVHKEFHNMIDRSE